MAKGTLVFEYASLAGLEAQVRAFLGDLVEEPPAVGKAVQTETLAKMRPTLPPPELVVDSTPTPPATVLHETPQAPQTTAASPEMTLETLAAADHKTLVAFVDAHPEVGVTLTEFQRGNNIWREFVAQKIKNWLESR